MGNKKIWEHQGEESPYYSVSTIDQFRPENLDENNLAEFFKSGEDYIDIIWNQVNQHFTDEFEPKNALDFGCGVGRLTLALAPKCKKVLGVDVSSTMVKEAQSNASEKGLSNVTFEKVSEDLSDLKGKFDFVHSFIVIQHISPKIGYGIFRKLVESVETDGIGIIQLTYANPFPKKNQITRKIYEKFPLIYSLRNAIKKGKPEPLLPMYMYDLNKIFQILHENDCHKTFVKYTDHGLYGIIIFFQKSNKQML